MHAYIDEPECVMLKGIFWLDKPQENKTAPEKKIEMWSGKKEYLA